MFSKDRSRSTASTVLISSGLAALLASSALFLSTAKFIEQLNQGAPVSLDVQQWSWLREIRFDLEKVQQQGEAPLRPDAIQVFSGAIDSASRISAMRKSVAPPQPPALVAGSKPGSVIRQEPRKAARRYVPRAVVIADEVTFKMSAPIRAEGSSKIQIPQAGIVQDAAPDQQELMAMQQMHGLMKLNLVAALTTQVPMIASVPAQLDLAPFESTGLALEEPIRVVSSHPVKSPNSTGVTKKRPLQRNAIRKSSPSFAGVSAQPAKKIEEAKPVELSDDSKRRDELVSQASAQVATMVQSYRPAIQDSAPVEDLDQVMAVQAQLKAEPVPVVGPMVVKNDYSAPRVPAVIEPKVQAQQESQQKKADAQQGSSEKADSGVNVASLTGMDSQMPSYVRAFDWTREVSGVQEGVTTQDSHGGGWSTYSAQGHWNTLARRGTGFMPMLSDETARFLGLVVGTQAQKNAGIVFGRIPDGWSASFSGRSEQGLFLTSDNKSVRPGFTDGARYFAFINAAPGAHLLYFVSKQGAGGAVAVPVLNGTATYVDFETLKKQTLAGRVMDASAAHAAGLSGIRVKAIGGKETLTAKDGSFQLKEIWTAGDHPVFVETEGKRGFTHRYQISPSKSGGLVLFRLGEAQARDWIAQLEGGISPESGMIVGIAPSEILSDPKTEHFPAVRPMLASSTLIPETYTISGSGQLQVKSPLGPSSMRYLSVQVPEGPLVVSVGNGRDTSWSELVVTSPGVVSLLNP